MFERGRMEDEMWPAHREYLFEQSFVACAAKIERRLVLFQNVIGECALQFVERSLRGFEQNQTGAMIRQSKGKCRADRTACAGDEDWRVREGNENLR